MRICQRENCGISLSSFPAGRWYDGCERITRCNHVRTPVPGATSYVNHKSGLVNVAFVENDHPTYTTWCHSHDLVCLKCVTSEFATTIGTLFYSNLTEWKNSQLNLGWKVKNLNEIASIARTIGDQQTTRMWLTPACKTLGVINVMLLQSNYNTRCNYCARRDITQGLIITQAAKERNWWQEWYPSPMGMWLLQKCNALYMMHSTYVFHRKSLEISKVKSGLSVL